MNPRLVAVTAEVVVARRPAKVVSVVVAARVLVGAARSVVVAARLLAEAARSVAVAARVLVGAASEAVTARVLVAAVPTDREAAFDPGVRVVTAAALAHCAAEAPAGDAARRLTVEAANDAAAAGAPIVGEVGAEAAVLRG